MSLDHIGIGAFLAGWDGELPPGAEILGSGTPGDDNKSIWSVTRNDGCWLAVEGGQVLNLPLPAAHLGSDGSSFGGRATGGCGAVPSVPPVVDMLAAIIDSVAMSMVILSDEFSSPRS
jgi:hypothetical protein